MPLDELGNDRWVVLENDIRATLQLYGVADELWLVHDIMVAFRLCLTAAGLVKWETAKKYYQQYPGHLDSDQTPANAPFKELEEPRASRQ